MPRFIGPLALLAAIALTPFAAQADDFPSRPVRIIVPQTPGGASDALARIIGQKLGEKWKQPVVIDNRPGAGGNVGMEFVMAAPADGYTLLMSYVGTQAINGALYKKLPFDPGTDFAPVATLATLPFVLVGKPDTPYRTVAQLVDAAKTRRITYGSAGNGSVNHLVGEMFNAAAGVKLVHVPYRGAAPALQDLMGGQIDLVFTSLPSVAGSIKSNALFPIAVTSAQRATSFNNIPTIAEAGGQQFGDFDVNPWFGLMGPKRMPAELVQKINNDVNELLRSKEVIDSFAAQGAEPLATRPEQFGAMLKADLVKWGGVVKTSGASVD
ncbi:MAG: LacI family transcriptional regulator [Rhodoferax sp.]|nr:LacI family transcriptional regulator [Rhodoferax sp.]